jgi:hypothetical protein
MSDPLSIIAESYQGIHETNQLLAATLTRLEQHQHAMAGLMAQGQQRLEENQRLAMRVQAFAMTLLGLSLLGTGFLIWYAWSGQVEHSALLQSLRAATLALEQRLR